MKIRNENNKIWLCDESGASCMLMQKPEIEDYGNLSKRALVTNYHLKEETIWERFCSLAFELQDECAESGYLTCYLLLFAELFYVFIGNGQMKNIICYGICGFYAGREFFYRIAWKFFCSFDIAE